MVLMMFLGKHTAPGTGWVLEKVNFLNILVVFTESYLARPWGSMPARPTFPQVLSQQAPSALDKRGKQRHREVKPLDHSHTASKGQQVRRSPMQGWGEPGPCLAAVGCRPCVKSACLQPGFQTPLTPRSAKHVLALPARAPTPAPDLQKLLWTQTKGTQGSR